MTKSLSPQKHDRTIGQKVARAIGILLILAGLGMLAYIGWQYYGTNIVSKQKQEEVKQQITEDWGKGLDSDAIGLLRVPRFGDTYEKPIVKGFGDDDLSRGVGWDTKSAKPGQIGNFAIAGHRVTHGEVFSKFPKLKKGDLVYVETRTDIFTYKLRNGGKSITVDFTVGWPLQRVPDPKAAGERPTKAVITMLTCSELFHTRNRNVVIGDLIKTVHKDNAAPAPASE